MTGTESAPSLLENANKTGSLCEVQRQEVDVCAKVLSVDFSTPIAPGFEAVLFKSARGIEDPYELLKIRKAGLRFPAAMPATDVRNNQDTIRGYLRTGTNNTARKQVKEALIFQLSGALKTALRTTIAIRL